jgi:hypothetical protein
MEFLSEFVGFLLQCAFWYFLMSLVIGLFQRRLDEKEQTFKEQYERLNQLIHRVQVEKHNEVYYWFDADDDEFLGQGKDMDEAVAQLKKRFPGHIFLIADKTQSYRISGPDWEPVPIKMNDIKT